MAIKPTTNRGFALLVAVIFVSVMLAFGTALGSLGYKQQVLTANATRSQYAFYAADSALECALVDAYKAEGNSNSSDPYSYAAYPSTNGPVPTCGGLTTESGIYLTQDICRDTSPCIASQRITRKRFEFAFTTRPSYQADAGKLCADVTVYEMSGKAARTTYVFAQGYDVPCNKVGTTNRIVTRGLYSQI